MDEILLNSFQMSIEKSNILVMASIICAAARAAYYQALWEIIDAWANQSNAMSARLDFIVFLLGIK